MEESKETDRLKKLSQIKNKLELIIKNLETDINNMEQQKKRIMKL